MAARIWGTFALLGALTPVWADLPIDCRLEEVVGRWVFTLSKDLGKEVNCTGMDGKWSTDHELQLDLKAPDIAVTTDGVVGRWSMIYNQGFEVYVRNQVFFAFSKFEDVPDSKNKFIYCGQTFNGWFHVDEVAPKEVGCFGARKSNPQAAMTRKLYKPPAEEGPVDPKEMEKKKKEKEQQQTGQSGAANAHGDGEQSFSARINAAQRSWVAGNYPPALEAQLERLMSTRRAHPVSHSPSPSHATVAPLMGGGNGATRLQSSSAGEDGVPQEWDWRNVHGVNYLGPVRDQLGCGSCYAFASAAMLEARYRIATNMEQQPVLSPQHIVDCSFYSQGCGGGFAYLTAGKYAKDYGMVEEECMPYNGSESHSCPHNHLRACRRWYSNHHRYVGGFYGATTEYMMRKEIYEHGPVAVGLQVYADLLKYKSGVYHYTGLAPDESVQPLSDEDPLVPVNHALVCVGFGIEKETGEKYWVIQNSWGAEWGDKGFFKVRRGTDEVGVESLVLAADPVL